MKEKNGMRKRAEKMYHEWNKGKINCRVNKYEVMRGIWKGIALSTIMYGIEVTETRKKKERRERVINVPN